MNQKAEWPHPRFILPLDEKPLSLLSSRSFTFSTSLRAAMVAPAPDTSRVQLKKKHVCRRQTKSFTPRSTPLPTQKMHLESLRLNTFKYIQITSVVTNDAQCEPQSQSIVTMIGMHFVVYLSTFPTLAQETSKYAKCANMDQWLQVQNMRSHPLPYAQLRAFSQRLLLLPLRPVVPLPWRWGSVHGRDNNSMSFALWPLKQLSISTSYIFLQHTTHCCNLYMLYICCKHIIDLPGCPESILQVGVGVQWNCCRIQLYGHLLEHEHAASVGASPCSETTESLTGSGMSDTFLIFPRCYR